MIIKRWSGGRKRTIAGAAVVSAVAVAVALALSLTGTVTALAANAPAGDSRS